MKQMKRKCLYCYGEITNESLCEFHVECSRKFFGQPTPPTLDFTQNDIIKLAEKTIHQQKTITGVQPKLSLGSKKSIGNLALDKLTIIGLWNEYILKPQTTTYTQLPENESLTMHLAQLSNINTVPHTLIRLKSGELAYITKRVDRVKDKKLHMEDMCQLTERLTEHKYRGSHEQIAKAIKSFSNNPGLDVINFYELVLFCFLTGNNDMHLKNFSLLKSPKLGYNLCPAYDLVASELVVEGDNEELALNLNGKKRKLKKQDFLSAMKTGGVNDKTIDNIFKKFKKLPAKWHEFIDESFLNDDLKTQYHLMINEKFTQIALM